MTERDEAAHGPDGSTEPVLDAAGVVLTLDDAVRKTDLPGHPGFVAHRFVRPPNELSGWLLVALDVVEPGGGIHLRYREGLVAEHAYYMITGGIPEQSLTADSSRRLAVPCMPDRSQVCRS